MRLAHLALTVADQARSRRFYETYFGFAAGPATRYDDGVLIIRDAHGFDLALGEGEVGSWGHSSTSDFEETTRRRLCGRGLLGAVRHGR